MQVGKRIIYNAVTGRVLNDQLNGIDSSENLTELRPETIGFVDLPYGSAILEGVASYHIDVTTKEIIVDNYVEDETV